MGTKQNRARKAHVCKTTERSVSYGEQRAAEQRLLKDGLLDTVRAAYFCDNARNMPIAGTERPKPCPFCGKAEVSITFEKQNDGSNWARAQCENCGTQGREADGGSEGDDTTCYGLALEAARLWNEREGGAS